MRQFGTGTLLSQITDGEPLTAIAGRPDYELGRLYHAQGLWRRAREQYDLVLAGKHLEISTKKGKGKVSLQVSAPRTAVDSGLENMGKRDLIA